LSEYSVNVIEHLKSGVQWIFVPQTLTLFRAEEIERNRYLLQTDVIGAIVEVEGGLMDGRDWLLGFHRYVRPAAVAEDVIHYVETVAQRLKGQHRPGTGRVRATIRPSNSGRPGIPGRFAEPPLGGSFNYTRVQRGTALLHFRLGSARTWHTVNRCRLHRLRRFLKRRALH
jgi:hypothetical protein